jgi:hypothetical protein
MRLENEEKESNLLLIKKHLEDYDDVKNNCERL